MASHFYALKTLKALGPHAEPKKKSPDAAHVGAFPLHRRTMALEKASTVQGVQITTPKRVIQLPECLITPEFQDFQNDATSGSIPLH